MQEPPPTPSDEPYEPTEQLLRGMAEGDESAANELLLRLYSELRGIAGRHMHKERRDHTLQATALVNEAMMKLLGNTTPDLSSRAHFLRLASRAMRNVLVDHARIRKAAKRRDGAKPLPLDEALDAFQKEVPDLLDLNEALERLEELEPKLSTVVELRFFGGLTIEETAEVLDVTTRTVERNWATARAWLRSALGE